MWGGWGGGGGRRGKAGGSKDKCTESETLTTGQREKKTEGARTANEVRGEKSKKREEWRRRSGPGGGGVGRKPARAYILE